MDLTSLITLVENNTISAIILLLLLIALPTGIIKLTISRKNNNDTSIKIGKVKGNNNSIAGRDVSKK